MERNEFCIAYTYKGSSTGWYKESYNRFVQGVKELAEFLQNIEHKSNQYELVQVYRCSFEALGDSFVETIIHDYKQEVEFIKKRDEAKAKVARQKLNSALSIEEQQILGIIK